MTKRGGRKGVKLKRESDLPSHSDRGERNRNRAAGESCAKKRQKSQQQGETHHWTPEATGTATGKGGCNRKESDR